MNEPHPFSLRDADEAAAESPYTFFIPLREERVAVVPGDLVKLGFEYEWETQDYGGERMWVKVTGKSGLRFTGTLDNDPYEMGLEHGLSVDFGIEHILDIQWADPAAHPPFHEHRTWFDRCLVDACVDDDGVPVEYIYREEPDMGEEGDTYPDSGWRIRGRDGDPRAAPLDERKLEYIALGRVLNRDDSFRDLLDAPVGSAFMRNFETGRYDPCG
ncbi:DUF2185 domain-containing protein [Novosphingobium sp.]|uniref:immunity protein Imm33 domain-containing protein n=1 Tax=Novosphingobium sp. TaxID=1874826 RepID=UPI0038BB0C08